MKTLCRTVGSQTYFIISELDLAYYDLVRDLAFSRVEDGFAKVFPTDSPHLDHIYHNFARCAEELILQKAGIHPAPCEQALLALLEKIKDQDIDWWLVGSAALAVRGIDLSPHDIDLSVDDDHTRIEWVGGVDERADTPEISDFGPIAVKRRETINWHGYQLQVPPLDLQLMVSERRELTERAEKIKHFMMNNGRHT